MHLWGGEHTTSHATSSGLGLVLLVSELWTKTHTLPPVSMWGVRSATNRAPPAGLLRPSCFYSGHLTVTFTWQGMLVSRFLHFLFQIKTVKRKKKKDKN